MRVLHACTLLALFAASTPLRAHGELPSPEWCAKGVVTEVSTFRLEAAALQREADAVCINSDGSKTCGQFDDDYGTGLRAAQHHCEQFARPLLMKGDLGTTSPLLTGPKAFVAVEHHSLYTLQMGVEGLCLRCDAPPRTAAAADGTR